jgi:uncharacterized protein (TIGR02246 family)
MKRWVALGVFLACTAAAAVAQMKQGSAADEAAIRDLATQYTTAWNSGDASKAAAVYTDDAVFVNVRGTPSMGRAEIERNMAQDLSGEMKGSTFDATMDTIRFIRADIALVQGTTSITGGKAPPEGLKGHYLLVATKQGGAWKALAVHAAAMPPPPPPN